VNTSQAANDADFHKCKKSPRAELGQLALGLFSGRPMGTFIVIRNRNRKLSNFDHFFGGAGPQRRTKGGWAVGGEKQSTAVPEEPPKKTDRKNQTRECRAVPLKLFCLSPGRKLTRLACGFLVASAVSLNVYTRARVTA